LKFWSCRNPYLNYITGLIVEVGLDRYDTSCSRSISTIEEVIMKKKTIEDIKFNTRFITLVNDLKMNSRLNR